MYMQKHHGLTLIELMVTLAIVAVLITAATPAMRDLIVNRQADKLAQEIQLDLAFARNQAISEQATVTVSPINNNWNTGWNVLQNAIVIREKGSAARPMSDNASITSTFTSAAPLTFDASGRAVNAAGNALLGSFTVNVPHCTGLRVRTIRVNFIGQISTTEAAC